MTSFTQERFSRFLFISLLMFMGISLALVMGSLYWVLSRSMSKEFTNEIRARQAEMNMILHGQFTMIGSKLYEFSLDNSLRVNLMLGMDKRLEEQLAINSAFPEGTEIILLNHKTRRFYPCATVPGKERTSYLQSLSMDDTAQCRQFISLDESSLVSIWSVPVMRRDERLGTLFAVYDLARDTTFWERVVGNKADGIYFRVGTDLVNLETRDILKSPAEIDIISDILGKNSPGMIVTSLKDFPGLVYAVSSKPLYDRKHSLILMLSGLLGVVTILTLFMSSMLARKVAIPLTDMVTQMSSIADEPFSRLLQTGRIPYTEFRALGQAFNQVLTRLTEVKEREDRARNFLDAILNTAADPIFVKNDRSELIIINDAFCHLMDMSREELIGKADHQIHDPHEARVFNEIDAGILANQKPSINENTITSRTGRKRLISTKKTLLVNPVTNERFIVGVARDVTEARRLEEELAQHRDHLADLVAEKTAALSESNQKLVQEIEERRRAENERCVMETRLQRAQKMELIGTLAGGVAHDLNNILSGIVSYPELLLNELEADNPMRKKVEMISKAGLRAADIVQDLLTLTRRGVTVTETVSLNSIIEEFLESPEMAWVHSRHTGVTVRTSLDKDLLNIKGSSVHLIKVVMNMVINAAEAMPQGGVIDIITENQYVEKPVRGYESIEPGVYTILTIRDTGVGIEAEDLERIFEPFYTKKVMGRSGTGLGMAVVWGTVKDHHGYIDVLSEKDRGTTFTLYFPVSTEVVQQACPQNIDELMGEGETIVVVDDVEEQRMIASEILTSLKYKVVSFPSGEDAVEYLKMHSADLVMLDMIMDPGMDGLDTYRQILTHRPLQKAIIASGYAETERVREALHLGAGAYLKKPYRLERIGKVIKDELRQS